MVDSINAAAPQQLPQFTTVKYTTKDGENISATKKDGIVTLNGDKNGVRQMPVDEFMKNELPNNVKNIKLEKTPEKDTVEISKPAGEAPKADKKEDVKAPVAPEQAPVAKEAAPADAKATDEPAKQPEVGKKLDVAA